MSFPIEFYKPWGKGDFFANLINFTGNSAVVGFGGFSLAIISDLALKTLGFSRITKSNLTVIPAVMSGIGIGGTAMSLLGATVLLGVIRHMSSKK